jgi:hypothetical protein
LTNRRLANAIQVAIEEETRLWPNPEVFYRPSSGQTWSHVAHRITQVVMLALEEHELPTDNDALAAVLRGLMSIEDGAYLEEVDLMDRVGWRLTIEADTLLDKTHADIVRRVLQNQETRRRVKR